MRAKYLWLAILIMPTAAWAQYTDADTLNRLDRLQRDMSTLQQTVYRNGGLPPAGVMTQPAGQSGGLPSGAAIQFEDRLQQLEEQLRTLTDISERNERAVSTVEKDLEMFKGDVDLRFRDLQDSSGKAAETNSATPAPDDAKDTSASAPETAPEATPETVGGGAAQSYGAAYAQLKQGHNGAARTGFKGFLQTYPKDSLASNAQYWLAETYYADKSYKEAAEQFLKGYQDYPKSAKAPDSLFKLALSLDSLDNRAQACETFGILEQDYPTLDSTMKDKVVREKKRLKCG